MWKLTSGAVALAVVLTARADAETLSLKEALETAYESSPQLEAQRAALRAIDEGVAQANAGWRPTLSFQGSFGYQKTRISSGQSFLGPTPASETNQSNNPLTSEVVLSQPIFRGGRTWAEVARAKALDRSGREQLINVEEGVLLDAATAYMNVVRDAATVNLKQKNVAVLQKELDATEEQFKVGELTRTDVAEAQVRLAGAQSDLVESVGQLEISRSNFEHFVGRPALVLEKQPPLPVLPLAEQALVDGALVNNPVVIASKDEERAADYAVDDATGAFMPQVSIQGQYQYAHDQPNTGTAFGIGESEHVAAVIGQLSVPIYQGGAEDSAVRQAEDQDAEAKMNIAVAQRQVTDAARTAWHGYVSSQAAIKSNKAQADAAAAALDGVQQEQKFGSRTVIDVLNAEQELLNAQVAVVSSNRDSTVAAYQVLSALGKLTAKDLGLRVKLYNPAEYYDDNASRWFGTNN